MLSQDVNTMYGIRLVEVKIHSKRNIQKATHKEMVQVIRITLKS
jgi:hypothetical protein